MILVRRSLSEQDFFGLHNWLQFLWFLVLYCSRKLNIGFEFDKTDILLLWGNYLMMGHDAYIMILIPDVIYLDICISLVSKMCILETQGLNLDQNHIWTTMMKIHYQRIPQVYGAPECCCRSFLFSVRLQIHGFAYAAGAPARGALLAEGSCCADIYLLV